jgi:hypothetical protein
MSHIDVRRALGGRLSYVGRDWMYDFEAIPSCFNDTDVVRASERLLEGCAPLAKAWSVELNTEWLIRLYYSAKLILGASVMVQSATYARTVNLRSAVWYLDYYALLNVSRAVRLTDPFVAWNDGALLKANHEATIAGTCSAIERFDKSRAADVERGVRHLKAIRELISYRVPSRADAVPKPHLNVAKTCRLLAEVAQFHSELLEVSLAKHATEAPGLDVSALSLGFVDNIEGHEFVDREDQYRLDYLRRMHPFPANIQALMSEGHVEDYFGAWSRDADEPDQFDPDEDWRIIFDVP